MKRIQRRALSLHLTLGVAWVALSAMLATVRAQSTWDFFITDAGGGNSLVTWSVSGPITQAPGIAWSGGVGFPQAVLVSAPGIFADSYVNDGTPQNLPTPDGSRFVNSFGDVFLIGGYYTYKAPVGGEDGFGLLPYVGGLSHGAKIGFQPMPVTYYAGTQSAVIPVDYSVFNPGFYQSSMSQFSGLVVSLTVGAVPEPSTQALSVLGALGGLIVLGWRKRAFARRE